MTALTLLLIRHAEKPANTCPCPGVNPFGSADSRSLTIRGWQRAGAWAALFGGGNPDWPRPDHVYAAKPGEGGDPDHGPSNRPAETATPLARQLGLPAPQTKFAQGEEEALVTELLTLSGTVLVAWEHKAIVEEIIPRLTIASGEPPKHWPGDRFDAVLRFKRPTQDAGFEYEMLCPQLLHGDPASGF